MFSALTIFTSLQVLWNRNTRFFISFVKRKIVKIGLVHFCYNYKFTSLQASWNRPQLLQIPKNLSCKWKYSLFHLILMLFALSRPISNMRAKRKNTGQIFFDSLSICIISSKKKFLTQKNAWCIVPIIETAHFSKNGRWFKVKYLRN